MKRITQNSLLLLSTTVFLFLTFEFVVFKFFFVPREYVGYAWIDGMIKRTPNQRSSRRSPGKIFRINSQGWQSGHENYSAAKRQGVFRIAVIGDSFVDAAAVDYNKSLAERLERMLGPEHHEVYRFGMPAAPLSQYLHIFREEVLAYSPDLVVFVLIHNDFDESYNIELGSFATSFLRLDVMNQEVSEIAPEPYKRPWFWWIRRSATYRYLVEKRGVNIQGIKDLVNRFRFRRVYQANIDISDIDRRSVLDERATAYVFRRIAELAEARMEVLLVMDGDRGSIYAGRDSAGLYAEGALRLNAMAEQVAAEESIPFFDLHEVFERDYAQNQRMFNSARDRHWNEYGHEVVAKVIHEYVTEVVNREK